MITTRAALKREYCTPGDALVDDAARYRRLWEEAGGHFVHHRDASQSIAALRRLGFPVRDATPAL